METGFGLSDIHPDLIETHILPRLDGRTLAAVSCVSSDLRSISTADHLWSHIVHSTWPSTNTPRLHHVISSFPNGPISFFSHSLQPPLHAPIFSNLNRPSPKTLISAVDLFYKGEPVWSKARETETESGWFKTAPFRISLVETREAVPTPIPNPERDDTCEDLYRELELSWIVVDPIGRRAVNVAGRTPVSVHRRWSTGEVQAKFVVSVEGTAELVAEVTCVPAEGRMAVGEVVLGVVGVEGGKLSGEESLEVLRRGFGWGSGGDRAADGLVCVGTVVTAVLMMMGFSFGFGLVTAGSEG